MTGLFTLLDAIIREQAVAPMQKPQVVTFPDALETLHAARYTGQVLLHWHEGRVTNIDVPNPVRVKVIV